jgi:para-nitrobenzyl esterase
MRMRAVVGVLVSWVVLVGLLPPAAPAAAAGGDGRAPVVRTAAGLVRGAVDDGVRRFQGIPYAAPPVGESRWRAPRPVAGWGGVRDARRAGSRCPQAAANGAPASVTEDCLFLNVTAPRVVHRPRPVLVWIHGGGLVSGAGSDYDPARLVRRGGLVVVTVNYRLGNLGFLGFPGLADGGAFGIEDQQAALRWVRDNIRAFGGDPRNVTVAGESGGAHSVCAQLASPAAAGLFRHAIAQSTPCPSDLFTEAGFRPLLDVPYFVPLAWQEGHGVNTATTVGCADLACLRAAPVADVLAAPAFPLPAFGNAVLPEDPTVAFAAGRFNHVPLLTGITRDEGTLFSGAMFPGLTAEGYASTLDIHFGAHGPAVLARYPVAEHGTPGQAMAAVMSDLDWALPQQFSEERFAARMPVYAYEFLDRTAPPIPDFPAGVTPLASHAAELAYLFDVSYDGITLDRDQARLADRMIDYWSRFAATGDPNGPHLPAWHRSPSVQGLDPGRSGIGPVDRAAFHDLAFWRSLSGR